MKKSLWQSCLLSDVRDYLDSKISYIRSKDELFKSLFWVIDFMWSQYYQNLF